MCMDMYSHMTQKTPRTLQTQKDAEDPKDAKAPETQKDAEDPKASETQRDAEDPEDLNTIWTLYTLQTDKRGKTHDH